MSPSKQMSKPFRLCEYCLRGERGDNNICPFVALMASPVQLVTRSEKGTARTAVRSRRASPHQNNTMRQEPLTSAADVYGLVATLYHRRSFCGRHFEWVGRL